MLFPETYETRDRLVERYGLTLRSASPDRPARPALGDRSRPLLRHPEGGAARASAPRLRRLDHRHPARPVVDPGEREKVEWSERYGVWKIQPLVDWDAKRVDAYALVNEIPVNPLHEQGYPSIGCVPCTRPVRPGEDERAGRWAGSGKLECGIHVNAPS